MNNKGFSSKCVHGHSNDFDTTGAISVPIYQSATFVHEGLGKSSGYDYSRLGNPTRSHLEASIANLEGGTSALAFSTGMAATTSLMSLFNAGDHIVASEDLYGGSLRLFRTMCTKRGIKFDFVNTGDIEAVKALVKDDTKGLFIETPTNPMMQVTDIKAISDIAKSVGALLMVDNTFMTPYYQNPIELGADIIVHSGTKYLGGHNDTLAGLLVLKDDTYLEELKIISKTIGAVLAPFDSWLILRGIKTLPIRMRQQQASAIEVANWLQTKKWVKKVYYSGLKDHPGHEIMKKQARGFSGMISFEVDSVETVKSILDNVEMVSFAESLGGVETLITYPMTQTHIDVPEEERNAKGINDRLLRLSVGLEEVEDILYDLEQAAK